MDIYKTTGKFPTVSFLKDTGQNDLSVQIVRRGGFAYWARKTGLSRDHSDSDTGWDGEAAVQYVLESSGFAVERSSAVRWPFDLLVSGVLRIDVKTARFATYGNCTGWFFRIGKSPQADVIALYQADTKDILWIPWYHVPKTNITISKSGGIYARYKNQIEIIKRMVRVRIDEKTDTASTEP